jgi:enoyl-[acyl-carrier-protein] reductase (NADH)
MLNLEGKVAVVFGLANKRSIAWGIVQKLHTGGAKLAISYQNERMKAEAEGLINDLPGADAKSTRCLRSSKKSTERSTCWCIRWLTRLPKS